MPVGRQIVGAFFVHATSGIIPISITLVTVILGVYRNVTRVTDMHDTKTSSRDKSDNVVWHATKVNKHERSRLNNQQSAIIWFTGLSGSGKSTIACALEKRLFEMSMRTYILDGDNMRYGLNRDLGFSEQDRRENIRRIGEVAKLFVDAGVLVLSSFISPFIEDRRFVRRIVNSDEFIEIYVKCPLPVCEQRDPKGLYARARKGEIKQFTGIDSPYEEPEEPEITIDTSKTDLDTAVDLIIDYLYRRSYIDAGIHH